MSNITSNKIIFAKKLREEREHLGLMQKEMAEKLNLPPNTYNGYETGKRSPSLEIATQIADALNVSADYLLGRTDNRNLTVKDEKSINKEKDIEKIIDELMEQQGLMLCGEPMNEEDMLLLRNSIRSTIEMAKNMKKKD